MTKRGEPSPINQALNRPRAKLGLDLAAWMTIIFVSVTAFLAGFRIVALASFPTLLDLPQPVLLTYPKETVVAEKFEAMVKLAIANSRMKDFYDLGMLAATFDFDGELLLNAIKRTFERRKTPLPLDRPPLAFTSEFSQDEAKNRQWKAFITKNRLYVKPVSLEQAISEIRDFLDPLLRQEHDGDPQSLAWRAGGPWMSKNHK